MSTLVDKNPYEAWDSKNTCLAHIKYFGCSSIVYILKEKKRKLNIKLETCIFIWYNGGDKGDKIWN